jgi:hypothetical protein
MISLATTPPTVLCSTAVNPLVTTCPKAVSVNLKVAERLATTMWALAAIYAPPSIAYPCTCETTGTGRARIRRLNSCGRSAAAETSSALFGAVLLRRLLEVVTARERAAGTS